MTYNDGGPWHPSEGPKQRDANKTFWPVHPGVSTRVALAGEQLAAIEKNHTNDNLSLHEMVAYAYTRADKLIAWDEAERKPADAKPIGSPDEG